MTRYFSIGLIMIAGLMTFTMSNLKQTSNEQEPSIEEFSKLFPQVTFPVTFGQEYFEIPTMKEQHKTPEEIGLHLDGNNKRIPYEFTSYIPGMISQRFSRMPPNRFEVQGKIYEDEEILAVVYTEIPHFSMIPNQADKYILMTYDKKDGVFSKKLNDGRVIASWNNQVSRCTFTSPHDFEIETVDIEYNDDGYNLKGKAKTEFYYMSAHGTIQLKSDIKRASIEQKSSPLEKKLTVEKAH